MLTLTTPKNRRGLTLLEVTLALALWMILSAGVLMLWRHSTLAGGRLVAQQSAFENARAAMDALLMNIQMAWDISLETCDEGTLRLLTLWERDPLGHPHQYRFHFDVNAAPGTFNHQRLRFNSPTNEFAAGIASIHIKLVDENRMRVTVTTGCEEPIILEGSVDVRYKNVLVNGV